MLALLGAGAVPCHWAGAVLPGQGPGVVEAAPPAQRVPAGSQEVRVDLSEWALTPDRVAVAAGRPVRFVASNSGALPHALVVQGDDVYAETPSIGSAGSARLELTFAAPGVYDLFCPIGAGQHRLLGQDGRMAVVVGAPDTVYPLTGEAADAAIVAAVLGPDAAAAPPLDLPEEPPAGAE